MLLHILQFAFLHLKAKFNSYIYLFVFCFINFLKQEHKAIFNSNFLLRVLASHFKSPETPYCYIRYSILLYMVENVLYSETMAD